MNQKSILCVFETLTSVITPSNLKERGCLQIESLESNKRNIHLRDHKLSCTIFSYIIFYLIFICFSQNCSLFFIISFFVTKCLRVYKQINRSKNLIKSNLIKIVITLSQTPNGISFNIHLTRSRT